MFLKQATLHSLKILVKSTQPVTFNRQNFKKLKVLSHTESNISGLLGRCSARRNDGNIASYVTRVATHHDCMDAGARATQEQLPRVSEQ